VMISPDEIVKDAKKAGVPSRKNLDALHSTIASLEAHLRQKPTDWSACATYACREEMVDDLGIQLAFTVLDVCATSLQGADLMKAFTGPEVRAMGERYPEILAMIED
jgi:hypothetical protein